LWKPTPESGHTRKIEGDVVDQEGKPIAGATVAAATLLYTDSVGVVALSRYHFPDFHLRIVTSDDHGHFVIPDGPEHGAVVAQLGDRRSAGAAIADHLKLTVLPTRRLAGKVTLGGVDYTQTQILIEQPTDAPSGRIQRLAMIMPDGSFSADGVSQTKVAVGVLTSQRNRENHVHYIPVPAGHEPVTGLTLDATATTRMLDVIVRSKLSVPIETAQIVLFPGKEHFANAGQLNAAATTRAGIAQQFGAHVTGEHVPKPLVAKYRAGDLIAHFSDVPAGDVTVCTVGLPNDLMDPEAIRKFQAHVDELEVDCEIVDGQADSAIVATNPPKNFD